MVRGLGVRVGVKKMQARRRWAEEGIEGGGLLNDFAPRIEERGQELLFSEVLGFQHDLGQVAEGMGWFVEIVGREFAG